MAALSELTYLLGCRSLAGLSFVLSWASACDQKDMIVPDLPWLVGCVAWIIWGGSVTRAEGLTAMLVALVFGLGIQYISFVRYGFVGYGGADVKLGCVAGLFIGVSSVMAGFALGSLLGLVQALCLKQARKLGPLEPFPFVPALSMGMLMSAVVNVVAARI